MESTQHTNTDNSMVGEIAAKYRQRQRERLRRRGTREMQRAYRLYLVVLLATVLFVLMSVGLDLRRQAIFAGYRRQAFELQAAGQEPDRAKALLDKVIANDPTDGVAIYHEGLLLEAHDPGRAAEYLSRAAELPGGESNPILLRHLGDVLMRVHRKHSAIEAYQRYLERAKNSPEEVAQIPRVEARLQELRRR